MKSPVRELRDALGISQAELGRQIKKSVSAIQGYEGRLPPDWCRDLADLAARNGRMDYAAKFERLGGIRQAVEATDLASIDDDEQEFLQMCLAIKRNPKNVVERDLPVLVAHIYQLRNR